MEKRAKNATLVLTLILISILILSQLAGCAQMSKVSKNNESAANVPAYLNLTGFPIVKMPMTLKGMVNVAPSQCDNYGEIFVWQEYEKMTGIKINWIEVPQTNVTEKRNLALASGDLPDFFYRMGISDNEKLKYGEAGIFLKLNDLIDKYGPNFKKVMDSRPDARSSVQAYNGDIYALVTLNDGLAFQINPKLFINKEWLDNLKLNMPVTTEELYITLKAFKERDPNRNGKPDEVPWSGWNYRTQVINALKGSFGLGNRGQTHNNIDVDPRTGKLRYQYTAPEFKDTLEYLGRLYQEGLIDQEIFTNNNIQGIAKVQQGVVGMVNAANTATLGVGRGENFVGLPGAYKGPKGEQIYAATGSQVGARASFVMTNANKYPEATMRWVDFFYSEEGVRFFYMGVEGKTYYRTPEGKYEYLPEIVRNIPAGTSFDTVISKYTPYGGGGSPTIVMTEYFKGGETQPASMAAVNNLTPYIPKEIWEPFNWTIDEMERLSAVDADIANYVNQMIPRFISGKEPLSNWDAYVDQIKKMGLDEYLRLYETAYERYKKK